MLSVHVSVDCYRCQVNQLEKTVVDNNAELKSLRSRSNPGRLSRLQVQPRTRVPGNALCARVLCVSAMRMVTSPKRCGSARPWRTCPAPGAPRPCLARGTPQPRTFYCLCVMPRPVPIPQNSPVRTADAQMDARC